MILGNEWDVPDFIRRGEIYFVTVNVLLPDAEHVPPGLHLTVAVTEISKVPDPVTSTTSWSFLSVPSRIVYVAVLPAPMLHA